MTKNSFNKYQPKNALEKDVKRIIKYHLSDYDNPDGFFDDLFRGGCISGMIGELIYYTDTAKFTKKHLEDIMELVEEAEEEIGEPLKMDTPKTNWLAWFGFEETARKIYQEIENEDW